RPRPACLARRSTIDCRDYPPKVSTTTRTSLGQARLQDSVTLMLNSRFLFLLAYSFLLPRLPAAGAYEILSDKPAISRTSSVRVDVVDQDSGAAIPVRVIVTSSSGEHVDGSGQGLYRDGRFFAVGSFQVHVPPGDTLFQIAHGPHYVSVSEKIPVQPQRDMHVRFALRPWFSPADRGWYGGDSHVHAQHDATAAIKTDLRYMALQARANDLNFVTEAGSAVDYTDMDQLDTPTFLLRYAPEIRPGPYVGHLNTPGIQPPLAAEDLSQYTNRPLPAQSLFDVVRQRGGVVIHTHPMTPPHQLHWMGAGELYSDAVMRNCANLVDVDAKHTQQLWFAALNLGNDVGVSSYTDSALGRVNTASPGDRRLYCHSEQFDYVSLVDAMRQGRTMATNGGPVFVFLNVDSAGPGETLDVSSSPVLAHLQVHALHKLREIELFQNGRRIHSFPQSEPHREQLALDHQVLVPAGPRSWLVARVEDEKGNWCLTSPIYLRRLPTDAEDPSLTWSAILEINNAIRFVRLRREFFAHMLVTVRPPVTIQTVELLRNGEPIQTLTPEKGDQIVASEMPVTGIDGEYQMGWVSYPGPQQAHHFQADLPVTASGWYAVRASLSQGQQLVSDACLFEASHPQSHALSIAHLSGRDTQLTLWGYGEEVAVSELLPPFERGEWWYPRNTYWRLQGQFGDQPFHFGWPPEQPVERFRVHASRRE
ncbi:MAG: CehA/McbA family metallohydrolase, partial [Planctomycetales bacterium]|nr:CehA/McbA family metallohydrolase [Planctomycetales bacterium]